MKEERAIKRKKRKIKFWTRFLVFLMLCGGLAFLLKAPLFEVSEFTVEGNNYYSAEEIRVMGNCKTGGNIFIGIDLRDIKERLEKDAYMRGVKIKRVLPSTIKIELDERRQLGAIAYGEKYVVVDKEGIVLRKTGVEPKLTVLKGLTISKLDVGQPVEAEERVMLRQSLQLLSVMDGSEMFFKTIEISEGEVEAHVLDNLICRGTPEHVMNALKDNYIQLVVQELFSREIERGTIVISGDSKVSFSPKID